MKSNLPKWAKGHSFTLKEYNLQAALSIATEALETVGYAQGHGHPLVLMKVCKEALSRIRKLGERC